MSIQEQFEARPVVNGVKTEDGVRPSEFLLAWAAQWLPRMAFRSDSPRSSNSRTSQLRLAFDHLETKLSLSAPTVLSLIRDVGGVISTDSATYRLTLSKNVVGVDQSDFRIIGTGGVTGDVASVTSINGSTYDIAVRNIKGDGTVRLDLVDDGTIHDTAGNLLGSVDYTVSFGNPRVFAGYTSPYAITVNDVNGDGRPDIIASDFGKGRISVLLTSPAGGYPNMQTYATGAHPAWVAVGDLNGDGTPDLAVANYNSQSVSVLINKGDGNFATQHTFATALGSQAVAIADFNGDGRPDLAVVNRYAHSLSILFGNGDGAFQPQRIIPLGGAPWCVATGDINGDGRIDLAIGLKGTAIVSELINNGNGTFGTISYLTGNEPYSVKLGDVNGDGKPDLIATDGNSGSVTVLLGIGNGTFSSLHTFATGAKPHSVTFGDINRDGQVDLIVANEDSNGTISVLLGNGNGTFQQQQVVSVSPNPAAVAVGDFNDDGRPDLAVAGFGSSTVSTLFNSDNGNTTGDVYPVDIRPYLTAISRPAGTKQITNANTVSFQVTFSEPVKGVDSSAFQPIVDGTLRTTGIKVTGSGNSYNVSVSGIAGDGHLGLMLIDHGLITDLAGNQLTAHNVTSDTYSVDQTPPSVAIAPDGTQATTQPIALAVTFSEPVSGFSGSSVSLTNATMTAFNIVDSQSFQLVLTPLSNGIVRVDIPADAAIDAAGNANLAKSATVTYVGIPTTTTLTSRQNAATGEPLVTFTANVAPSPDQIGTMTFKEDDTPMTGGSDVPLAGGIAMFTIATLTPGLHDSEAVYSGGFGFAPSTSNVLAVSIAAPTSTTIVATAPSAPLSNQLVNVTINVASTVSSDGDTVELRDAANSDTLIATGTLSGGTATIGVPGGALAPGAHSLVAVYDGSSIAAGSVSAPYHVQVLSSLPDVSTITINGNAPSLTGVQRSRVVGLVVAFNQPVQLDTTAFSIALHADVSFNGVAQPDGFGALPGSLSFSSGDNTTWTVTFAGNVEPASDGFASLKDGVYDLNIDGSGVHPLGIPSVNMVGMSTMTFHRLAGDLNAPATPAGGSPGVDFEAIVNSGDNLAFRTAFNNPFTYKASFDFNGDGTINSIDNLQFRNRFNKALTWKE